MPSRPWSILLLSGLATSTWAGAGAQEAPRARAAAAMALDPGAATTIEGTVDRRGERAPWRWTFDGEGRSHESSGGRLSEQRGHDGSGWWARTASGSSYALTMQERDEAWFELELLGGGWARPGSALRMERDAGADSNGQEAYRFELQGGGWAGHVWLGREHSLPVAYRAGGPGSGVEGEIGWRERDVGAGWELARHSQRRASGEQLRWEAGRSRQATSEEVEALGAPAPPHLGTRWRPGVPAAPPSRRVARGHLLLQGELGGTAGWFIFDTGAGGTVIDGALARELDLEQVGVRPVGGIGGYVDSGLFRGAPLTLGPLVLEDLLFIAIDLDFLSRAFGAKILGIVGFDALARSVAVLDQSAGTVEFHADALGLGAEPRWGPLQLQSRHPAVPATVEELPQAWFKLDSGAANRALTLHAPYVHANRLLEGRETSATTAFGVGGGVELRAGTLARFELGGRVHEGLEVDFATEAEGAFADSYTAGNIGGRLLEGRRLVLDYAGMRLGWLPAPAGGNWTSAGPTG